MKTHATNTASPASAKKRQRSIDSDDEDSFRSRAKVKNGRGMSLRTNRKKPQLYGASQLIDSYDMEIDEFDNEEKAELEKIIALGGDENGSDFRDSLINLGAFKGVPAEIIEQIADQLDYVPDLISMMNACKAFRNVLGPKNTLLWFTLGNSKHCTAKKFDTYDPKFNYLRHVKHVLGIESSSSHCSHCMSRSEVTQFNKTIKLKLCNECVENNVIPVTDLQCIEGLDLDKINVFTIGDDWRYSARHKFPHNVGGPGECPAFYVFKPTVMRHLSKLHPGKSYEKILQGAESMKTAYNESCTTLKETTVRTITDLCTELGLDIYKTAIEFKYAGHKDLQKKLKKADTVPTNIVDAMKQSAKVKLFTAVNKDFQMGKKLGIPEEDVLKNWAKNIVWECIWMKPALI